MGGQNNAAAAAVHFEDNTCPAVAGGFDAALSDAAEDDAAPAALSSQYDPASAVGGGCDAALSGAAADGAAPVIRGGCDA